MHIMVQKKNSEKEKKVNQKKIDRGENKIFMFKCVGCGDERKGSVTYASVNSEGGDIEVSYRVPKMDMYLEHGKWVERIYCSGLCDPTKDFWRLPKQKRARILWEIGPDPRRFGISPKAFAAAMRRV